MIFIKFERCYLRVGTVETMLTAGRLSVSVSLFELRQELGDWPGRCDFFPQYVLSFKVCEVVAPRIQEIRCIC